MNKVLSHLRIDVTRQGDANTNVGRGQLPFSPKTRITLTDSTVQAVKARSTIFTGLILAVRAKLAPGGHGKRHQRHTFTAKESSTTENKK